MTIASAPHAPAPATIGRPLRLRAAGREALAVLAATAAAAPALWPLLGPGLPATHDGFLHVQRLIALEAAARQGAPFARWLPDLAYGYGQPLLLYYAPLSYVPALAARLLGAGYVASIEIASGLALLGSLLALYLCARALVGPVAAGVAAVVYAVLPYQLVDLYVRGALAESWAFVWMPLAAWCLLRAWTDGRARWSVGLALALAGLVLTHNVTALLFAPALIVLAALLALTPDAAGRRLVPIRPLLGMGLGLGLSAGFWLPAILERGLIQIGETIEPALFASFLLRAWPPFQTQLLFDYEAPVSTALGSPIYWPQLGLVQALVTAAGAAAAWTFTGRTRAVLLWAGLLVVGGMALQAGPAAALYEAVPLLAFVQFPWRLLALIGLGSALLAGALVERVRTRETWSGRPEAGLPTAGPPHHERERVNLPGEGSLAHGEDVTTDMPDDLVWSRTSGGPGLQPLLAGVVVGVSVLAAVARLAPATTPVDEHQLSIKSILRAELADHGLGTTHSGEYLPVASGQRNAARFRKTLLDDPPGRADRGEAATPADALRIEELAWRPDRISLRVTATAPTRLVLHQFAFPGWRVQLDGRDAPALAAGPLGLLAVEIPPGRHVVEATWGWTGLRAGAAALSAISLTLLGALAGRGRTGLVVGAVATLTLLGMAILVTAWLGRPDGSESGRWQPADERLVLVDVEHDTARLAGERLLVTRLSWLVRAAPPAGYRASVEVVAPDGRVHRAPWAYEPLSRHWQAGEVVPTTVAVRLPPDFPAGSAALRVVFERPAGLAPLEIGRLLVPPTPTEAAVAAPASEAVEVGSGLRVAALPLGTGRPGAPLDVALQWTALASAPDTERELLVVAALDAPGGEVVSEPGRPGDWFAPLPFWQAGDRIAQRLRLRLPDALPPGTYTVTARVYGRDLARGGMSESGASTARPRGRPLVVVPLGAVTVQP